MFKVQTKSYSCGKRWQDLKYCSNGNRFASEAEAWAYIESLDQDGFRDTANYRVIFV